MTDEEILELLQKMDHGYVPNAEEQKELDECERLLISGTSISTLPESIGNLTNLQRLNISFTPISILPDSIGNLTNLQELSISGDSISTLPESIGNLTNLQRLTIGGTSISTLPDWIGNLTNLQSLDISGDSISTLPDWIGHLTNLQSLSIRGTSISTLPESIGNLTNLQSLDIYGTSISTLQDWIGNLTNLQSLWISGTSISTLPDWIGNLTNLQSLWISGTSISTLPDWIGNLTNLQSLWISGTSISTLPERIGNLTNLHILNISGDSISTLPERIGNLTNLHDLSIRDTSISTLPESIGNLTNLHILNISGDSISTLPESIGNLTNLHDLSISGTSISTLPESIGNLTNLHDLSIRNTSISTLPESIGNLTNLKYLWISNTSISTLPESMGNLTNLHDLSIRDTSISTLPGSIGNLTNLHDLSISDTSISTLPKSIGNLTNLQYLWISNTSISTLPESIDELPNLIALDLSDLTLDKIPQSLALRGFPFVSKEFFNLYDVGINLYNTTLTEQPISVFLETPELIPDLYAEQVPLHESKVIFLGDGEVGKSYTIKRMMNGGEPETEQHPYLTSETPGVEILDMPAEYRDEAFTVHFWDFGGQEILHSMHRCFLTEETGYVVVVKTREEASQSARKWLRNIHAFAPDSSVLMFLNCWENADPHRSLDDADLKKEFPQMIDGSVRLSAKTASKEVFNADLTARVLQMAANTEGNKKKIPKLWKNVIDELRVKTKANGHCITKEEYREICRHNGIDFDKAAGLLTYLNNIGVCYSYHIGEDKRELAEYSLLDPTWLTKALYAIIRERIGLAEYGIVQTYQIIHMLGSDPVNPPKDSEYTRPRYKDEKECQYIFDVAEAHDLCFRMGKDYLFFPSLCEDIKPSADFPDQMAYGTPIQYRLKYQYLPDSVVHKLMVRCYRKEMSVIRCWRKGMILSALDSFKAVVQMDDDEKTLTIDVYAKNGVDAKPYVLFKPVRDQILDINRVLGLTAKEFIRSGEDTFSVKQLLNSYENNIQKVSGDESEKLYNPAELLGRFFERADVQYENGQIIPTFLVNNSQYVYVDRRKINSNRVFGDVSGDFVIGDFGEIEHQTTENKSLFGGKRKG